MPIFNPLVSSAFTGVDENPLSEGGVWAAVNTVAAFKRLSNTAQPTSFVADCAMVYTGAAVPLSQYSRGNLTVNGTSGAGQGVGLGVRMQTAAATYYRFVIDHAGSTNATLARSNAGAVSTLVQWTQAFTDGDQFTLGMDGTKIYVFDKNLLLVQTFDDRGSALSIAANAGLAFSSNETSASVDNFEAGFFAFAAVGTSRGDSSHPGRSPGRAPYSARFWQPWSGVVVTAPSGAVSGLADIVFSEAALLTGAGALAGPASITFGEAALLKGAGALAGTATITFSENAVIRGSGALLGPTTIIFGENAVIRGAGALAGSAPIVFGQAATLAGVGQLLGAAPLVFSDIGDLTNATPTGAVTGIATIAFANSGTLIGSGVLAGVADQSLDLSGILDGGAAGAAEPVSKFRYIIRMKGRLHKSSHREMSELLDRVFATPDEPSAPAPLVEEVHAIIKPFVYKNELHLAKLEKDMRATRKLLDLWTAETARMRAEDEDDDETVMLLS